MITRRNNININKYIYYIYKYIILCRYMQQTSAYLYRLINISKAMDIIVVIKNSLKHTF